MYTDRPGRTAPHDIISDSKRINIYSVRQHRTWSDNLDFFHKNTLTLDHKIELHCSDFFLAIPGGYNPLYKNKQVMASKIIHYHRDSINDL